MVNAVLLNAISIDVMMLNVIEQMCVYPDCLYSECHYAECRGAIPSAVTKSVFLSRLSFRPLSVYVFANNSSNKTYFVNCLAPLL